jgi:hypothetical protein
MNLQNYLKGKPQHLTAHAIAGEKDPISICYLMAFIIYVDETFDSRMYTKFILISFLPYTTIIFNWKNIILI